MKETTVAFTLAAIGLLGALVQGTLASHPWIALVILGGAYFIWYQGNKE